MSSILDQRGNVVARVEQHGEQTVYMDRRGAVVARYIPNHNTTYDADGRVRGRGDQGMRVLAEDSRCGW